ncbi:PREDICTED: membrane-spanning 4-domains subfamily A member 12 [Elephantulus edwardii]|uniref:membrane-spanning 4-domains subfamily A member 12 n=1 Tax=Elephantulus edwardii TaxID=28737 RepID=UPI0003F0A096|nr:PREDICTED: membrane-spanning 4-domains subfamily A member 12 [Elephantulus edwardii]
MGPWSQQPPGVIGSSNQAQGTQPPFTTHSGVYSNLQQSQASIQISNPNTAAEETKFKEEAKVLGGIQIIIGLMHIGFGITLGSLSFSSVTALGFASLSFLSGYTFWGGISFIISGSLSVSASKIFSSCLIKGSLGMNIVSAIFSISGLLLLLVDLIINSDLRQNDWALIGGKGISGILLIFTLLEFCITCTLAHFATQAIANFNTGLT